VANKRKAGVGSLLGGGLVLLAFIAMIPRDVWVLIGIAGGAASLVYLGAIFLSSRNKAAPPEASLSAAPPTIKTTSRGASISLMSAQSRHDDQSDAVPIAKVQSVVPSAGFRVPPAPKEFGAGKWIPAGAVATVAGVDIPGGMLYVGTSLSAPSGGTDPCLIDPTCRVDLCGDYTERAMDYWPSYSAVSGTARRAYLSWLADGRCHPEADIGYVFLYFYGLERRVLVDARSDPTANADMPLIGAELRRLISIYGERSRSFRRYASELLDWVEVVLHGGTFWERPIADLPRAAELPIYLRLALGQAALAGRPVPPALALAWVRHDPAISLRTPATRCHDHFSALFERTYTNRFGDGLKLPCNRTKLKFAYRPASAGFLGREVTMSFGDVPDVTAVTGPIKKLQPVVDVVTKELEPYSRLIAKTPEAAEALEGHLLLPIALWSQAGQSVIEALRSRMDDGALLLSYGDLLGDLGARSTLSRANLQALARTLESIGIGFEPDVLAGARSPKPENSIVLFDLPPGEPPSHTTPAYQAARLTLQMASSVAAADGSFSKAEHDLLRRHVQDWSHLTAHHRHRLLAHLRLLSKEPMSLAALKQQLDSLSQPDRESIASFMATVAQSDGMVSPAEVKLLEKLYKALGVDGKKVFSDLHTAASGAVAIERIEQNGFVLDQARIAALQQDTHRVSVLLSAIFTEAEDPTPADAEPQEREPPAHEASTQGGVLGLDEAHSAFARLLLSRPQWTRAELVDVASDLDLMLDGALEQLNEAAYRTHDVPFTDGDDPLVVDAEIVERLEV
jgi:uncharacterized tellurite resistance protein B-like protein